MRSLLLRRRAKARNVSKVKYYFFTVLQFSIYLSFYPKCIPYFRPAVTRDSLMAHGKHTGIMLICLLFIITGSALAFFFLLQRFPSVSVFIFLQFAMHCPRRQITVEILAYPRPKRQNRYTISD